MRTYLATCAVIWMAASLVPGALIQSAKAQDTLPLEIVFEDGSRLNAALADNAITLQTQYGTIAIPPADVLRIDLAVRLDPAEAAQIAAAIEALDHDPQAKALLLRAGERALPALTAAAEVDQLIRLTVIREVIDAMQTAQKRPLILRDRDTIATTHGTFRGTILLPALKIRTSQFGLLTLNLADARMLRPPGSAEPRASQVRRPQRDQVQNDPGNLSAFASRIGDRFWFRVTGAAGGSVWGTDVYTSDSHLAAAAVHAGILKLNETGVVEVEIVPPLKAYRGSTRHGVVTHNYGSYDGAYRLHKPMMLSSFPLFTWWTLR